MIVNEYQLNVREYVVLEAAGPLITVLVWASPGPANLFLVNEENLRRYQTGSEFTHHGPGMVRLFNSLIQVPAPGPWYAIVENAGATPVRVGASAT